MRFGVAASALFATVTTDASCGAVNAMHDSFTPLGGLVPLANIQLGEVIFGGVGAGLYGMLVFVVLTVFIAGLMVGRTPEYLGKKIEAREMKLAMLYVLIFPLIILGFSAWARSRPTASSSLNNAGPHGLIGDALRLHERRRQQRLGLRRPQRQHALVQRLARHRHAGRPLPDDHSGARRSPARWSARRWSRPAPGTFPTNGAPFTVLLVSVIVIVGALTFFPALSLGTDRRALRRPQRKGASSHVPSQGHRRSRCSIAPSSAARSCDSFRKLVPAARRQEPGHVRGRDRQRAHHAALRPRPRSHRAAATRAALVHGRASRSGCGSRCVFANFAEAVAEGRGKAQADTLRKMRKETIARRLVGGQPSGKEESVPSSSLRKGDLVVVEAGELIPGDGEIIEGIASVDESAITGESAPVIRESGGDRSAVTGGTKVLSDRIVVRIAADPGRVVPRPHDRAGRGRRRARRRPTRSRCTSCWSG